MKIVIIGAGISGLSTYLFLKKHLDLSDSQPPLHSVKIYEAHGIIDNQHADHDSNGMTQKKSLAPGGRGYAIGITSNGLEVVSRLDEESKLYDEVRRRGCEVFKWRMSTARGQTIAEVNMSPEKAKQTVKNGNESLSSKGHSIMITRQAFWDVLKEEVVKYHMIVEKKRVKDIKIGQGVAANVIEFTDGTKDEADLIIGADGLRSALRKAMYQNGKVEEVPNVKGGWLSWLRSYLLGTSSSATKSTDYVTPHYENLVGVGDFIPSSVLQSTDYEPGIMNIIFGPNGFFGHGCTYVDLSDPKQPKSMSTWWSTFYSASPDPYSLENSTLTPTETFDQKQAIEDLTRRHGWWKQPIVQTILKHVQEHGISQVYPTYTTPELPTWQHGGKVVLIGDAAHALQPSSGQGASQALEDAESLSLLLKHYLNEAEHPSEPTMEEQHQAVSTALDKFVKLRRPRVHAIYERSQRMSKMKSDMGFVTEMFMYTIIRIMSWFGDSYNEKLLNYNVPDEVQKIIQQD